MLEALGQLITTVLTSPEFAAFVVTGLIAVVGFLAKQLHNFIGEKVTGEQLKTLMVIAENAVRVAEQTGLTKTGEEKKQEALKIAQTYLDAYGIKVNAAQLEAAIESAVYNEFTQFKDPVPVPAPEVTPGG